MFVFFSSINVNKKQIPAITFSNAVLFVSFSDFLVVYPVDTSRKRTKDPLKTHICSSCGRVYQHQRSLWRHRTFECNKLPAFPCNYCSYRAHQKAQLLYHLYSKHRVGKKPKNSDWFFLMCMWINNKYAQK